MSVWHHLYYWGCLDQVLNVWKILYHIIKLTNISTTSDHTLDHLVRFLMQKRSSTKKVLFPWPFLLFFCFLSPSLVFANDANANVSHQRKACAAGGFTAGYFFANTRHSQALTVHNKHSTSILWDTLHWGNVHLRSLRRARRGAIIPGYLVMVQVLRRCSWIAILGRLKHRKGRSRGPRRGVVNKMRDILIHSGYTYIKYLG